MKTPKAPRRVWLIIDKDGQVEDGPYLSATVAKKYIERPGEQVFGYLLQVPRRVRKKVQRGQA